MNRLLNPSGRLPRQEHTSLAARLPGSSLTSCLCLSLAMAGCSGADGRVPVYPVKGKVTVSGEIPEGALVVLYPVPAGGERELRPSGKVRQDGTFSLTTYDSDDGAPPGDYAATIQWNKLINKGQNFSAGPNVIPKEFADRAASIWKVKVTDAPNDLAPLSIGK